MALLCHDAVLFIWSMTCSDLNYREYYIFFLLQDDQPFSNRWNFSLLARDPQHNINLENDLPSVLQFPIQVEDIGGTLSVKMALNNAMVRNKCIARYLKANLNWKFFPKISVINSCS